MTVGVRCESHCHTSRPRALLGWCLPTTSSEQQAAAVPELVPADQVLRHPALRATKGSIVPSGMDGSRTLRLCESLALNVIARTAVVCVSDHVRSLPPPAERRAREHRAEPSSPC